MASSRKPEKPGGRKTAPMEGADGGNPPASFIARLVEKGSRIWEYWSCGVWSDTNRGKRTEIIRTISLSVKSFLNSDIQSQACAMTYRTMLAVVPALALLLAIGRGFGFQTILQDELMTLFPAQRQAIAYALNFVDSYMKQSSSEGAFVGIGIVFLLWTLISLVSNVEDTFNLIWGVKDGRSFWRKITDYTAMFLILPVLMICASGINLMLSSTMEMIFKIEFLTPLVSVGLELASAVFTWAFFAAVYMLIPNTTVRFKNALIAGIIAGTGFMILQWLFVTGTLYVTRYNAIYGSMAFLPLLLLWMQLAWVICLSGAVICYSSQNIFQFSFNPEVDTMSSGYRSKVIIAIATVVTHRFSAQLPPITNHGLIEAYGLPSRLVSDITARLCDAGIFVRVVVDDKKEVYGYQLAVPPDDMTVGFVWRKLEQNGSRDFIPDFDSYFPGVIGAFEKINALLADTTMKMPLADIKIKERPVAGDFARKALFTDIS